MDNEASWVTEMRRYFAEHGCYRAEDVYRLLGNPCEGVIIGTNDSPAPPRKDIAE